MKLWIDDREAAPDGWLRVRTAAEAAKVWRAGRVREASLGGSPELVQLCAQAIEQGAFTGRLRPMQVALRFADGPERAAAEVSLAKARTHWETVPTRADPPRRQSPKNVLLRFVGWHVLGFAVAVGGFEVWHLLRHGTHAPLVAWFIPEKATPPRR